MNVREHWETIYTTKEPRTLGWRREHLDTSLALIETLHLPVTAEILDVGCGISTLVDDLLAHGSKQISLLDVSSSALRTVRERLGETEKRLSFIEGDVRTVQLDKARYDLWHDRAVFHFLTQPDERARYHAQVVRSLKLEGHVIIGVFSHEAPPRCSGLPVQRYSVEELVEEFESDFTLQRCCGEMHITPGGVRQPYLYAHFLRTS
ncbi:MAG: SAM-dependent methyltransferase [Ignavibacteria bacterium]